MEQIPMSAASMSRKTTAAYRRRYISNIDVKKALGFKWIRYIHVPI